MRGVACELSVLGGNARGLVCAVLVAVARAVRALAFAPEPKFALVAGALALLDAKACVLIEEVEDGEEAHHIARVPIEEDGARARREQGRASASAHQAVHAQAGERRHDHAVDPHDVARIPGDIRGERVGDRADHREHLRCARPLGTCRDKATAQENEAGHGGKRNLYEEEEAEEVGHLRGVAQGDERV